MIHLILASLFSLLYSHADLVTPKETLFLKAHRPPGTYGYFACLYSSSGRALKQKQSILTPHSPRVSESAAGNLLYGSKKNRGASLATIHRLFRQNPSHQAIRLKKGDMNSYREASRIIRAEYKSGRTELAEAFEQLDKKGEPFSLSEVDDLAEEIRRSNSEVETVKIDLERNDISSEPTLIHEYQVPSEFITTFAQVEQASQPMTLNDGDTILEYSAQVAQTLGHVEQEFKISEKTATELKRKIHLKSMEIAQGPENEKRPCSQLK